MWVTWPFLKRISYRVSRAEIHQSPKKCIYKLWNNFSKMLLNIKLKPLNINHLLYLKYNIIIERVSQSGEISVRNEQCWKSILDATIWVMSSVMSCKPQKISGCPAHEADFGPCCKKFECYMTSPVCCYKVNTQQFVPDPDVGSFLWKSTTICFR